VWIDGTGVDSGRWQSTLSGARFGKIFVFNDGATLIKFVSLLSLPSSARIADLKIILNGTSASAHTIINS
jgi:hypothetical protein